MAKILIVEDEDDQRELLRELLTSEGHTVVEVDAARHALAAVKRERPDLVVMDIGCPAPNDGILATAELRADPETQGVVVVAASGHAIADEVKKAHLAGCNAYVMKPFDFDAFLSVIAKHLPPESPR